MSYILDALRKADAERERGSVPGLHTQSVPAVSGDAPAPPRGVPVAWVVAGASAVAVAAVLAWALSDRHDAAPRETAARETMRPPEATPVAPMAAAPVSPAPVVAAAPAPVAAVPPPPVAAPHPAP